MGGFFLFCKSDNINYMQIILLLIAAILLLILLRREMARNLTESSFIAIVNHTFRTPLTRIKWMSENLEHEIPRKEQIEISKSLNNAATRLLDIVDTLAGIKDIHNQASYQLKAVSVREIIEEGIQRCGADINNKSISLEVPVLNNLPLLSINTKKISFVVQVVLENAIMYSNIGGKIIINADIKNSYLILSVADEGIGMNWRERHNIFRKFYRSENARKMNTDGMGLGLYISKEIVRRHRGQMSAISKGRGFGSTFYIELPILIS